MSWIKNSGCYITHIVQSTYYRLACLFADKAQKASTRVGSEDLFSEYYHNAIRMTLLSRTPIMSNSLIEKGIPSQSVRPSTTGREGQWELSRWTYKQGGVIVGNFKLYICLVPMS